MDPALLSARVVAISPLERPDPGLVAALCDGGALGVLDLGRDRAVARRALAVLGRRVPGGFGVRIPEGVRFAPGELPAEVTVVVVTAGADVAGWAPRPVLVQVTSLLEAQAAVAAGAAGLIAKGSEAGGRIGEETAFVLLQQLADAVALPVWVQGGIGLHTAAACLAGGATGVVLDSQLALVRESSLGAEVRGAIGAMDGSETTVIAGHRLFTRPDLAVAGLAGASADDVRARLGGDDLASSLLPVGQDGSFARMLAQRFVTAGQVVRAIDDAIGSHLAEAAARSPLAPGAPLAAAHGMRYPIAQGPMSRVSDRARFAEAVADAGGLPFLALTLMTGGEVRALLVETAALLGDRPWGVGILGFVPQEIREQQLAVLRDIRPPVALIAGGRPSQAGALDAQGTATYLHVPSPGLLDLFLRDGARRFVFEGRECGGHVGPRSSFALWEVQIERLLAHPAPEELSVLFAGGIHDARSAAMVAAMAAPLAARGARIGVLMGTAYLFTDEAVAAGAIQPGFQAAAIACDHTVLLETGPGHATRCADTAFAAAFTDEKRRLEQAGTPAQEVWAALEQLNLGRLRVAAKGLRRDGAALVAVDAAAQRDQGMYMIGQVAALRRATCSMAELHRDVSEGGTAALAAVAARLAEVVVDAEGPGASADIAIVGLAAIFAGAPDTDTFWRNIVAGKNAIREVPPERWSVETYYDPAATGAGAGRKTPCKWGGFLDDIAFDPLAYGIPPRSLEAIEPVQLLSLEIARRALADAGYAERAFDRERTSVIFGAEAGTDLSSAYGFRAMFPHYVGPLPAALEATLPVLTEDSFPGVLANVIAGRIANRLDLGGVNYTVDAACAASLAAVDLAVKELVGGTSDMVLCGGADLHNSINDYLLFASVHALSPTGQCHTFDANADGIVLGEGVGCVVLKRLADAERDGDRVYAVIKGVAGGSDGKSLGLTAPRKDGQIRALERAYRRAGVSPAQVGLVEAHGTGTVVGDRTELATLTEVYAGAGVAAGACVLGSVKSQIGHTKCAAGMAGLIKAALAVHHGVLPPTLNLRQPNPYWRSDTSPFAFLAEAQPWPAAERVAAVSAFGFGGTNFHLVLASHRGGAPAATGATWPAELLLFRGVDPAAAVATVDRLRALLAARRPDASALRLRDLARSVCAAGRGPVQLAVVADDVADLIGKLDLARELRADRRGVYVATVGDDRGAVAFLCPGQGSQKLGMLAELFIAFPRLQRLLALGERWAGRMFPPAAFGAGERAAQAAALTDTRVAQPALGIADLAVAELLQSLGVFPDMTAGHSYGELAALCIAGVIDERDLLALSEARGELILAAAGAEPGAMLAVAGEAALVATIAAASDGVVVANHNSPGQTVLSGSTVAVEAVQAQLIARGLTARRLPVACAFHSPIVAGAQHTLGARLAQVPIAAPTVPVYSNTTAGAYPHEPDAVRALLAAQVARPVRFVEEIEAMYAAGARVFVETGPGQVLTNLVGAILGDRPHLAVACDHGGDAGVRPLLRALGALAVRGIGVDAGALFWDRDAALVELEPARVAAPAKVSVGWLINGHTARPVVAPPARPRLAPAHASNGHGGGISTTGRGVPMNGQVIPINGVGNVVATARVGATSERDAVVLEYLRGTRELIAAQRDIMLGYLGQAAAPAVRYVDAPSITVGPAPAIEVVAASVVTAPAASVIIDPMELVLAIVSERTGYPAETLGPDLDLEADLSIDSIKRIEIVGELAARLGLQVDQGGGDGDAMIEELATRKTLRAMVTWLAARLEALRSPAAPAATPPAVAALPAAPVAVSPVAALTRHVLDVVEAPHPGDGRNRLAGRRFTLHDDGRGIATRLAALLHADGATTRIVTGPDPVTGDAAIPGDGFIHLGALRLEGIRAVDVTFDGPTEPTAAMRTLFEQLRAQVLGGAQVVLVATGHGGHFGRRGDPSALTATGGAAGIVKTLAAEWPTVRAKVVDLDPRDDLGVLAAHLRAELLAADDLVEVGYPAGVRSTLAVVAAEHDGPGTPIALGADSVVLLTGGARGITAQVALELARRYRCKIELVGRSPLPPAVEAADLAAAADAPALRRLLIAREPGRPPAAIEATCAQLLAAREVRANLTAIRAAGAEVAYHPIDVRSPAFAHLVDDIYARHGRLDGVVHGAGVLEDKLIRHKTVESFERVFGTKLDGAMTLADRLRADVRFVILFGSVAGAFGNRGQVDYAAANDALDQLAWSLDRRLGGRVVSIDWGPWAGAGMVSPELEREYARRGIGLIEPAAGIEALFAELRDGAGDAQVILMAGDPARFRPRTVSALPPAEPAHLAPPRVDALAAQGD